MKTSEVFYYSRNWRPIAIVLCWTPPNTFIHSPYVVLPAAWDSVKLLKWWRKHFLNEIKASEGGLLILIQKDIGLLLSLKASFSVTIDIVTPVKDLPKDKLDKILYGSNDEILIKTAFMTMNWNLKNDITLQKYINNQSPTSGKICVFIPRHLWGLWRIKAEQEALFFRIDA
jgi:hypothetical protein